MKYDPGREVIVLDPDDPYDQPLLPAWEQAVADGVGEEVEVDAPDGSLRVEMVIPVEHAIRYVGAMDVAAAISGSEGSDAEEEITGWGPSSPDEGWW